MWIAVDKNGEEALYPYKPVRGLKMWLKSAHDWGKGPGEWFLMTEGTIEEVMGIKMTWDHEPIEIDVSKWLDKLEEHPKKYY